MNTTHLKEYAELKIQEKAIAVRLKELAPAITAELIDLGLDKQPTTLGNFNLKNRKVWKYSDHVEGQKKILDDMKTAEEADGTATFVEVPQLEFREAK